MNIVFYCPFSGCEAQQLHCYFHYGNLYCLLVSARILGWYCNNSVDLYPIFKLADHRTP